MLRLEVHMYVSLYVSMYVWTMSQQLATDHRVFNHILDSNPVVCFSSWLKPDNLNFVQCAHAPAQPFQFANSIAYASSMLSKPGPCSVQTYMTMRFNANNNTIIALQTALLISASLLSKS